LGVASPNCDGRGPWRKKNGKLKQLVADLRRDKKMLQDVLSKKL